ncbi:FAD binding domain-containing protein [Sediminibacillus massiliensis]|uniref:FAD binding domain-containing protein n=1 Tax=Sediminibacillus massiliensis TaxID=1926277 RepID=UPI0009886397|nr:FAD binding domain-containing protein [Sediminibacillus massiliensis]
MGKEVNELLTPTSTASTLTTTVHLPGTVEEAWDMKKALGGSSEYIAGGTLMQLQREQGKQFPAHLVSLERIKGLKGIEKIYTDRGFLRIGAMTTLSECLKDRLISDSYSIFYKAVKEVASTAVRNRATISGNICYGIGDTIPGLLALDARVSWYDGAYIQTDSLENYLMKKEDTLLLSILLPERTKAVRELNFYRKVGRRESFIPSLVTTSIYHCQNIENEATVARIAVGGGTNKPLRLIKIEEYLIGKKLTERVLTEIYQQVFTEFNPASDPFVSGDYRKTTAANLICSAFVQFQEE